MKRDLHGLRIVITGASSGIGAELARQLAAAGCRVMLAARRADALEHVREECVTAGASNADVVVQLCDVTDRSQLEALRDAALAAFGGIDVWVSNAGSGIRHRLLEATDADMLAMYDLHVLAALHAYQLVAPAWIALGQHGQFVDICSVGGRAGYPFNAAYAAAKHGLSAVSDVARLELAPHGITVTTVFPGVTVSGFGSASPDRTDGVAKSYVSFNRENASWLRRRVSHAQPTAQVARAVVNAIRTRKMAVYPHGWGILAAVLLAAWPQRIVPMVARQLRKF